MSHRLRIEFAPVFRPLLNPKRYKGAKGGRGSGKSHFYADMSVGRTYQGGVRLVCIREVQNTIKDSVKQLISDKIHRHKVADWFDIRESEIRGPDGSLIVFRGMQSFNAENIKSLEDFDIAWIEEAQTLSHNSLKLLRPTIRKRGSEIWASWNPRFRTDAVDEFFVKHPHPDSICITANWMHNPWISPELIAEKDHDYNVDPDMAEHIWGGAYDIGHGAILARWVLKAEKEGRVNDCQYDPEALPVEITSDIGFRDTASWWVWQRKIGGYSLIHYVGDSGLDAKEWIERLKLLLTEREWKLGKIWLPHDARAKTFQSRETVIEQFVKAFGADKCDIVPQSSKSDRINAARTVIGKCEFNERECEEGLDGLRAWTFEYNEETQSFSREPLHNWASHPSDAYSYGCQVMQTMPPPEAVVKRPKWWHEQTAGEIFALDQPTPTRQEWV